MHRLLLSLTPANLVHQFGTGRALENVTRDREEVAETMAVVDALVGRIAGSDGTAPASGHLEPAVATDGMAA